MVRRGDWVIVVDPRRKKYNALVTDCFYPGPIEAPEMAPPGTDEETSINVVVVSEDAAKKDPYGAQIERHTSVVHESRRHGRRLYWYDPVSPDDPTSIRL